MKHVGHEKRLLYAASAPYEGLVLSGPSVTALEKPDSSYRAAGMELAIFLTRGRIEMKTIDYKGKIGGAILAFSLVLGIGIMSSMTAQAQDCNNGQWERQDRNRTERQDQNRDWRNRSRRQDVDQNRARHDDRYDRNNGYRNNGSYDRNRGYGNNGGYNGNQ